MTAQPQVSGFKARIIRETEDVINKLVKRRDQLFEEAAMLDNEIADARGVLQSLKGKPQPQVQAEPEQLPAEPPSAKPAAQRMTKRMGSGDAQKRWRDAVLELGKRPQGFTSAEIADHIGVTSSAFGMALKSHKFLQNMVESTMERRLDKSGTKHQNTRVFRYKEPTSNGGPSPKQSSKQPAERVSHPVPGTGRPARPTADAELRKILSKVEAMGGDWAKLNGGHIRVTNPRLNLSTTLASTSDLTAQKNALKKIGYRV